MRKYKALKVLQYGRCGLFGQYISWVWQFWFVLLGLMSFVGLIWRMSGCFGYVLIFGVCLDIRGGILKVGYSAV